MRKRVYLIGTDRLGNVLRRLPTTGLEPAPCCQEQILSLPCLPIPPHRREEVETIGDRPYSAQVVNSARINCRAMPHISSATKPSSSRAVVGC